MTRCCETIVSADRRSRAASGPRLCTVIRMSTSSGLFFGVFHEHVEISVIVEDTGIEQFVFELLPRSPPVGLDQVPVGKLALRVLVEVLHVGVRRRAVEVEVVLLHILAMIALVVREPEQALLQDRVALVPQRQRKTKPLLVVA